MKAYISSSAWFALLSLIILVVAQQDTPTGLCTFRNTTVPANHCGTRGHLKKPSPYTESFLAFDAEECAQQCYAAGPPCLAFGIQPSTDDIHPGNCTIYLARLHEMKFKKVKSSTTRYYDAYCYSVQTDRADSIIQDGGFSNSGPSSARGGDSWHQGYLQSEDDYSSSSSGLVTTDEDYASMYFPPTSFSGQASPSVLQEYISQEFDPCPGQVYQLTWVTLGPERNTPPTRVRAVLNGETVYENGVSGSSSAEEGPVYFTSNIPVQLAIVYTTLGEGNVLVFDNVATQPVYRGSLPIGTNVITVTDKYQ